MKKLTIGIIVGSIVIVVIVVVVLVVLLTRKNPCNDPNKCLDSNDKCINIPEDYDKDTDNKCKLDCSDPFKCIKNNKCITIPSFGYTKNYSNNNCQEIPTPAPTTTTPALTTTTAAPTTTTPAPTQKIKFKTFLLQSDFYIILAGVPESGLENNLYFRFASPQHCGNSCDFYIDNTGAINNLNKYYSMDDNNVITLTNTKSTNTLYWNNNNQTISNQSRTKYLRFVTRVSVSSKNTHGIFAWTTNIVDSQRFSIE
jgi:hypothetical protein